MSIITIELTAEMQQYADDIKRFVDLMVHKLDKNRHKGRWENIDANSAFNYLCDETVELQTALWRGDPDSIYFECADVANFAMIIASIMRERGND
jgi:hypothetical protein